MSELTITKSTIESYKIRGIKGFDFADIALDDNGTAGRISISTDHGDWSYYWSHAGRGFKKFLCSLDIGYVAGKFGCSNHFDFEATIKGWKLLIIEWRRRDDIFAETAREAWDEVIEIERSGGVYSDVERALWNSDKLLDLFQMSPDIVTVIDPGFRKFWELAWPLFKKTLKKEELETA